MSQAQDHEHVGPAVPQTRTARHRRIVDILNRQPVRSPEPVGEAPRRRRAERRAGDALRDLDELNAVKIRNNDGDLIYAVPSEGGFPHPARRWGSRRRRSGCRRLSSMLISAEASANLVALRLPAGGGAARLRHRPGRAAGHSRDDRG